MTSEAEVRKAIETIYREESRRVLATLIRLLRDFELAEEALADAFAAAVTTWPQQGLPANPRAWLVSAGRFKAVDKIRRRRRFDVAAEELARELDVESGDPAAHDVEELEDDRLRLIFTCCHPAIAPDAQVALTLREVCGLTTEEIARAFLVGASTVAQRIVRAKAKIREARIPYQVPDRNELPERLDSVLRVVYLVFNEGYSASSGETLTRHDVSGEAIRLGRLLLELLPEPEAQGLLALMLLHESRRAARSTPDGELVLLDDQDRTLWDRAADRRGHGARRAGSRLAAVRALHAAGGHRRHPRQRARIARDGLGGDHGTLRPARTIAAVTGRGAEPRDRGGDARRAAGRAHAARSDPGSRGARGLSPRALGPRRALPSSRPS